MFDDGHIVCHREISKWWPEKDQGIQNERMYAWLLRAETSGDRLGKAHEDEPSLLYRTLTPPEPFI